MAAEIASHAPSYVQCCICLDEDIEDWEAIQCEGGDDDDDRGGEAARSTAAGKQHHCCRYCLETRVRLCIAEPGSYGPRGHERRVLYCCGEACMSAPYSDAALAKCLAEDTFAAYLASRAELVQIAADERARREAAAEVERVLALNEHQRQVESACKTLADMLTLKCPRCQAAFVDFVNCMCAAR